MQFARSALCPVVFTLAAAALSNPLAAQEQRIVGGVPILLDEAPSIVALISNSILDITGSFLTSQFCAGTLISDSFVLTAAHCVVFDDEVNDPSELSVLPNTFDLNNPGDELISVAEIMVHENYLSDSDSYDIAILRLETPTDFPISEIINPDSLLELDEPVTIAGWGTRQFDINFGSFDSASSLEGAEVLVIPTDVCNALPALAGKVDETMVCAGFIKGGVDACQGDSGGPLYRQGADGEFILSGITSWGIGCAKEGRPGVYSNVAFFNDWILQRADATISAPLTATTAAPVEIIEVPADIVSSAEETAVTAPLEVTEVTAGNVSSEEENSVTAPLEVTEVTEDTVTTEEETAAATPVENSEVPADTVTTEEESAIAATNVSAEVLSDEGSGAAGAAGGGGSVCGMIFGALAFMSAIRRRSVKAEAVRKALEPKNDYGD